MTDREKVIAGIRCCMAIKQVKKMCEECPYRNIAKCYCCEGILGADILALLREQEPVEPDAILTNPVCGECHEPLDVTDEYCRHCGRAVKWRV